MGLLFLFNDLLAIVTFAAFDATNGNADCRRGSILDNSVMLLSFPLYCIYLAFATCVAFYFDVFLLIAFL